ncbi:putative ribosomal protein S11 [Helianthus annuus]|nr:putative ribosomal protein S11 [Helianthus annuus]
MVFGRIVSRFPGKPQRLCLSKLPNSLAQTGQKHHLFSGIFGNLGSKLGFAQENPLLASSKFAKSIHSVGPKEFERGVDNRPVDTEKDSGYFRGSNQRVDEIDRRRLPFEPARNIGMYESLTRRFADFDRLRGPNETGRDVRPLGRGFGPSESSRNINMNGVGGIMRENENYRSGVEQNADIVHVKIMRNNTFVTVTDSKGNKKLGASAGALAEMKGGPKVSKYSAEATAEHIGREAKRMGLKSVVLKVNGFTFFKKKKLAILSFRDGYTNSRSGERNPIVYLEDTTRKPHNGCRRKKQRRV